MTEPKSIVLLARRDHLEAMRVAAGLTIFDHKVRIVFMDHPVSEADAESEQAELLELSGVEPLTTVKEMEGQLMVLSPAELGTALTEADAVVNI